jgi:hypothetical protein
VRHDEIVSLTLLFLESSLPSVLAMIAWGQTEESMTWYPDANDLATSFVVWLHEPSAGTAVLPTRHPDYPKVLELTIELRRADLPDIPWGLDYYGNA